MPLRRRAVVRQILIGFLLRAMTKQDLAKWALELPAEDRVELGEALLSSVLPPLTEAAGVVITIEGQWNHADQ